MKRHCWLASKPRHWACRSRLSEAQTPFALRSAAWAPVGGLGYFNPYGECAGAMWRTFRAHLEARSEHLDVTAAAEAARATFAEVQAVIAAAGRLEGARR